MSIGSPTLSNRDYERAVTHVKAALIVLDKRVDCVERILGEALRRLHSTQKTARDTEMMNLRERTRSWRSDGVAA